MTFKSKASQNSWNDSKQLFFTPKLSLEGKNLFPQIVENIPLYPNQNTPFLNILKKPILSLYQRLPLRSQKKPVCIVGMPKEVQLRNVKTGSIKRTIKHENTSNNANTKSIVFPTKQTLSTYTPMKGKSQFQYLKYPSKSCIQPVLDGAHFYLLGSGNNAQLMQRILKRREGWVTTNNSIFHFRWEQARPKFQNISPPNRQVINHLPNHQAISDKGNLLQNLRSYCLKNDEYMYNMIPVSFILDFSNLETVEVEMKRFSQFYYDCINQQQENCHLYEENRTVTQSKKEKYNNNNCRFGNESQFEMTIQSPKRNKKDCNKNYSYRNIKNKSQMNHYDQGKKRQEIKIIYKSLVASLKPLYNLQDMSNLKPESPSITPIVNSVYGTSSLWLLKPSDLNRGRGIRLFRTVQELGELLKHQLLKNQKGSFILQKYLQRPMLIEQRKFDIRVWAMITQNRQLYFFKQGYIRLSSAKFTLDSNSLFTHLTNNAVQKNAANYGQFEQGNILPLDYLSKNGYMDKDDLRDQIKRHIITTIKAGGQKLYMLNQKNQSISVSSSPIKSQKNIGGLAKIKYFQIFGYDFMVDCSKNVWLIEVNTNPCIQLPNKWLGCIIPRMLDDALSLTLDRIFCRQKLKQGIQTFDVLGYKTQQNMWQLLDMQNPQTYPQA